MHRGSSKSVLIPKQERNAFRPSDQTAQPSSTPSVRGHLNRFPVSVSSGHCSDSYRVKPAWGNVKKVVEYSHHKLFAMLMNT